MLVDDVYSTKSRWERGRSDVTVCCLFDRAGWSLSARIESNGLYLYSCERRKTYKERDEWYRMISSYEVVTRGTTREKTTWEMTTREREISGKAWISSNRSSDRNLCTTLSHRHQFVGQFTSIRWCWIHVESVADLIEDLVWAMVNCLGQFSTQTNRSVLSREERDRASLCFGVSSIEISHSDEDRLGVAKKIFPHLVFCLLLLPSRCNLRQVLSKQLTYLLEQLLEHQYPSSPSIAELLFRTMNYLRQCPIDSINKRNAGKTDYLNFENHFWLDIDYFQLSRCASKYQCYQSAIIYADIWTTKQRWCPSWLEWINVKLMLLFRSILPKNDYETHLYQSDIDLLSSSDLIDLFVRIHSTMNQSDEFYGLEKCFQNRPNLYGEFNQLNNQHYDALFYYDQAAVDPSKLIQSLRFCGFSHILEQYLNQIGTFSDEIFFRIQLTSILTEKNRLTRWKTAAPQPESTSVREDILSMIQRPDNLSSPSLPSLTNGNLWSKVSDLRECSLVNIVDDLTKHPSLNISNRNTRWSVVSMRPRNSFVTVRPVDSCLNCWKAKTI